MKIVEDDLAGPEIAALLREHLAGMRASSPPESVHALDLAALRSPEITFWTVWEGSLLIACGALKEVDSSHGEIKSMRTVGSHVRKGFASRLLTHIIDVARARGYDRLSLETGSGPAFDPALALYAKFGFRSCGPFGSYRADPFSRFMTLELSDMKLAIIAYPHLSRDDRRWIEDFRKAHDPRARLIAAHFTLVFPVDVRAGELVEHAQSVLEGLRRFPFVLGRARAVRDLVGHGAHVFLVPERGSTEIVQLHDRLYSGFLQPRLRTDIPFIPHMTVAADRDFGECERLATALNEEHREIAGQVTGIDVVEGGAAVRSVAHLEFTS